MNGAEPIDKSPDIHSSDLAASAWFARRRRGTLSPVEQRAWEQWLAAAPAHAEAYQDLERLWTQAENLRNVPRIVQHRRRALRRRARWSVAVAASVLVCAGTAVLSHRLLSPISRVYTSTTPKIVAESILRGDSVQLYNTEIGQQRTLALADGSMMTLDTDSEVQVALRPDQRLVTLRRGRAFFAVAKDHRRPFIVNVGAERVMAVGTAFDVRLEPDGMWVTLREGRVRIEAPDTQSRGTDSTQVKAADLVSGTTLRTSRKLQWRLAKADVARELSWLRHQLVFDNATLDTLVNEINRYSTIKLVLGDPSLAAVPVGGVFSVDNPASVADALAHYGLVRVGDATATRIVLLAP